MSKTERALEEPGLSTAPDELSGDLEPPAAGSDDDVDVLVTDELSGDLEPPAAGSDDDVDVLVTDELSGDLEPPAAGSDDDVDVLVTDESSGDLGSAAAGGDDRWGGREGAPASSFPAPSLADAALADDGDGAHGVDDAAIGASGEPAAHLASSALPAPDPFALAGSNGSNGHHDAPGADTDVLDDDILDEDVSEQDRVSTPDGDRDPALVETEQQRTIPGEALRVSSPGTEILEELRHADIDGPTVDLAPQDDTSTGVRRPQRLADYDPAPIPIPAKVPRLLGRKPRVRKVTRVVRHVDPWSVFKIAIVANMVLYVIALTSGVLLWNVAYATGTVDNVERFFESFGWSEFEFNGGQIYHSAWIAGLFLVIGLTGLAVLAATLFNLITDLVGGMRFTVLEEEVVERRTSPMRRFVVRRPEPEIPAVDRDESGAIVREAVVDDSGAIIRRSR